MEQFLGLLLGYAFGSIPFGLLLAKAGGMGDIRKIGSGNIGATNVLRTGSKKLAAATLLLDLAKGLAPVLARFGDALDEWDIATWFASVNSFLGGRTPMDLLRSQPGQVLAAAEDEIAGVQHG